MGTTSSTTFDDLTVAASTAYLYVVRVIAPSLTGDSIAALANTVVFTDRNPTGLPVKAAHVTELRAAVVALRNLARLSATSFTDATIAPGVTVVKAVHMSELRSSADEARLALGFPAGTYAHPALTPGASFIFAIHLHDLRTAVAYRTPPAD